jgi:hypothetical protein
MIILRYARHPVGDSNDKNDKTQMLSDSQVIEVKPSTPKLPVKPPVDDKNDRSVWKGVVVGADDFAPPAPVKASGGRWLVVVILAAAAIGAGAYLVWPNSRTPAVIADAAATPAVVPAADTMPQDAAAADAPSIIEDAAATPAETPQDAAVYAPPDAGIKKVIKRKPPPKRMIKRKHP